MVRSKNKAFLARRFHGSPQPSFVADCPSKKKGINRLHLKHGYLGTYFDTLYT